MSGVSRLRETQIWLLQASGEGKGTMASTSTSVWEETTPPAFALKSNNSVSPLMLLVTFEQLPQYWSSEQVSPSALSAQRPFMRNAWYSNSTLSCSATISVVFHRQELCELLFLALEAWAAEPGVGQGPLAPPGGLRSGDISPDF